MSTSDDKQKTSQQQQQQQQQHRMMLHGRTVNDLIHQIKMSQTFFSGIFFFSEHVSTCSSLRPNKRLKICSLLTLSALPLLTQH